MWGRPNFLGLHITTSATTSQPGCWEHFAFRSIWNSPGLITRDVVNQGTHLTKANQLLWRANRQGIEAFP